MNKVLSWPRISKSVSVLTDGDGAMSDTKKTAIHRSSRVGGVYL